MSAKLHRDLHELWRAGLAAADPGALTLAAVQSLDWAALQRRYPQGRLYCLAVGKAASAMADALNDQRVCDWRKPGLIVTTAENQRPVFGFRSMAAGHPLPDARGLAATEQVMQMAAGCTEQDVLLLLLSGGASALLPAPVPGISLEDKQLTTDLLLSAGADIQQLNSVRKHLSGLKGGGLARLVDPARIEALVIADVLLDDPQQLISTVASGPSVADPSRFQDAAGVLRQFDLWFRVPESVRVHLRRGLAGELAETPKPGDACLANSHYQVIASNGQSQTAMCSCAAALGYRVWQLPQPIRGEARLAAQQLCAQAATWRQAHPHQALALIAGGETTVTVRGRGRGGRNQEFALAFALAAATQLSGEWALLSAGSDGVDGPTDAAGGLLDQASLQTMLAAGVDPQQALDDNDSYPALQAAEALFISGSTGTNVADWCVLLMAPLAG